MITATASTENISEPSVGQIRGNGIMRTQFLLSVIVIGMKHGLPPPGCGHACAYARASLSLQLLQAFQILQLYILIVLVFVLVFHTWSYTTYLISKVVVHLQRYMA